MYYPTYSLLFLMSRVYLLESVLLRPLHGWGACRDGRVCAVHSAWILTAVMPKTSAHSRSMAFGLRAGSYSVVCGSWFWALLAASPQMPPVPWLELLLALQSEDLMALTFSTAPCKPPASLNVVRCHMHDPPTTQSVKAPITFSLGHCR